MKPNEAECYICGKVMNRYWMEHIGIGRNSHWICSECFHAGERQADYITHRVGRFALKEAENK